jgi:hypothetical protein
MDVREKLVELLKEISYDQKLGWYDLWDMREGAEDIADLLIANGVTLQEWISVKDRLPEHGDIVLCHTKHDDLLVFQWCEMSHRWVDQYEDYRQDYITH